MDKQKKVVDNARPRRKSIDDSPPAQVKVKNLGRLQKSMTVDNSNVQTTKKATDGKADNHSPRRKPVMDHLNVQGKPPAQKATGNHSANRKLTRDNSKSRQKPAEKSHENKAKHIGKFRFESLQV